MFFGAFLSVVLSGIKYECSHVFIYNRGTYPTSNGIAVGNRLLIVGILSQTLQKRSTKEKFDYLNLEIVI